MTPISEISLKEQGWLQLNLNWTKPDIGRLYTHNGNWKLNGKIIKYMEQLNNDSLNERRYHWSLPDLIDRLSIAELKHAKIPENRAVYAQEIDDICHDIDLILIEKGVNVKADFIRNIIICAQFNAHIFYNEGHIRNQIKGNSSDLTTDELVEIAKKLMLTHSLNGIRSFSKNKMVDIIGGRIDLKVDSLAADAEHWRPAGY